MKTIAVKTGKPYQIQIGEGLLPQLPALLAAQFSGHPKLAVVTDDTVNALPRSKELLSGLENAGWNLCKFVFPQGESSKNLETVARVYSFLSENEITRTDCILALGGGVVGDLAGFAAATWLRGIEFVQIPTTLLAMVDSSVGGKTGVDLPQGKNLVGAFWQPSLVLCDPDMLQTLPPETVADGMAEVIKYGAILDEALFTFLESNRPDAYLVPIISRCIELKQQVVEQDERDTGLRQLLNFGHTLGHAVEHETNFTITHGQGVSIGMVLMARACERAKLAPKGTAERIERCCQFHQLPTKTSCSLETLCQNARSDKKRAGDRITLITLERIGKAKLMPIETTQLFTFMRGGDADEL